RLALPHLVGESREEHVRRTIPALRLGLDEHRGEAVREPHQSHVVADERPETSAGRGTQVEWAGGVALRPTGAAIARGTEPDVGVEPRAARGEMANIEPEHSDGRIAGHGPRRQACLWLLPDHDLRRPPVNSGVFRPGEQDGREVAVVLEPSGVDRVARRGGRDLLSKEAELT